MREQKTANMGLIEIPNEEFLQKPHAELLENAFQVLKTAYNSGDFELYERGEKKFGRDFEAFWKYRVERYRMTASTERPGFLGRYLVKIGTHYEEMEVRQGLMRSALLLDDTETLNMHIFRAEPGGNAWDVIDLEGFPVITKEGALYTKLKLDTTIAEQTYPLPSKFHLELNGGRIGNFQRTTVQYYVDEKGSHQSQFGNP